MLVLFTKLHMYSTYVNQRGVLERVIYTAAFCADSNQHRILAHDMYACSFALLTATPHNCITMHES
jgi:hypothetical protein